MVHTRWFHYSACPCGDPKSDISHAVTKHGHSDELTVFYHAAVKDISASAVKNISVGIKK